MATEMPAVVAALERSLYDRLAHWPTEWEGYHWPGYTYEHTLRVRALAAELGRRERADLTVLELAALLHDIRKDAGRSHAAAGAEEAAHILEELGVRPKLARRACDAVATHSGENTALSPLENMLLGDADLIDANFGLVAAWRFITIRASHDTPLRETVAGMDEWLPKKDALLDNLLTRSGRELARQRSARMRVFCEGLIEEVVSGGNGAVFLPIADHIHLARGTRSLQEQVEEMEAHPPRRVGSAWSAVCRAFRLEMAGLQ